MPYKFKSYSASKAKQEKIALLNSVEFSSDPSKAQREEALLSQALSFAQNNSTKLYTIRDTTSALKGILGLIALSASDVMIEDTKKPVILIDLLFMSI